MEGAQAKRKKGQRPNVRIASYMFNSGRSPGQEAIDLHIAVAYYLRKGDVLLYLGEGGRDLRQTEKKRRKKKMRG